MTNSSQVKPAHLPNSRKKERLGTLVAPLDSETADAFLSELLNVEVTEERALSRFIRRFKNLLPEPRPWRAGWPNLETAVWNLQGELRGAWRGPTPLSREVTMFRLIARHFAAPEDQTHPDAYMFILRRALQLCDRMRVCQNELCQNPYFIAQNRRQKYCSEVCARPAQHEFKARWWKEHGVDWQRERRAKAKASAAKESQHKGGKRP